MKKLKAFFTGIWTGEKRSSLMFVIMAFVFTAALYAGDTSNGFISTFPIFFFAAALVFVFYDKIKTALILTAVLTLALSLATSSGYNSVDSHTPTMKTALVKVLFFIFSAWVAYKCVQLIKRRKKSCYLAAGLATVAYIFVFTLFFGNIFSAVKWHNSAKDYLKENYPLQPMETMVTSFDFSSRHYKTQITFKEPQRSYYGEENIILQENYDGYFLYAKNALFEIGQSRMTEALRASGSKIVFNAQALPFEQKLERTSFDLGADYDLVLPYLSYEITLSEDIPNIDTFQSRCQEFADALNGVFEYSSLRFYGGEKGGLLFEADCRNGQVTSRDFDQAAYIDNHRKGALNQ